MAHNYKLLIKFDSNNQPVGLPMAEQNVIYLFPDHDWTKGYPAGYAKLVRTDPNLGTYEKLDPAYNFQGINGHECVLVEPSGEDDELPYFTSKWHIIPMTDEEKKAYQDRVKADWAGGPNYASWTFNESKCNYDPPKPYPIDGQNYLWDEDTTSWKLSE